MPLTSVGDTPNLITDASYKANSAGGDGDCLCHVCVRLPGHGDARYGNAMLRYDALRVARPRAQPAMLQDHALHARAFSTASLSACSSPPICFRRGATAV